MSCCLSHSNPLSAQNQRRFQDNSLTAFLLCLLSHCFLRGQIFASESVFPYMFSLKERAPSVCSRRNDSSARAIVFIPEHLPAGDHFINSEDRKDDDKGINLAQGICLDSTSNQKQFKALRSERSPNQFPWQWVITLMRETLRQQHLYPPDAEWADSGRDDGDNWRRTNVWGENWTKPDAKQTTALSFAEKQLKLAKCLVVLYGSRPV